jgi:aldose 1-epimerase
LYTPPDRKSIAIENLSGAPNAFNNKIGLHYVKPQEDIVFETSYQVVVK